MNSKVQSQPARFATFRTKLSKRGMRMDQAGYFRSHPPRCIKELVARPVELQGVQYDGHASRSEFDPEDAGMTIEGPDHINTVFALSCQCGGNRHYVHCYRWVKGNAVVTLSPLALECARCRNMARLLDTDVHGYDSELGASSATVHAQGDRVVFDCPGCGRQPLEVFVRFEYSDDLFDRNYADFSGREQDLFSWFSLIGRCPQCSQLLPAADFECA